MDKSLFNKPEEILKKLGVKMTPEGISEFAKGLFVEREHGPENAKKEGLDTDVTGGSPIKTGKIALIHINEVPDYYTRLEKMEKEGKRMDQLKAIIRKNTKHE